MRGGADAVQHVCLRLAAGYALRDCKVRDCCLNKSLSARCYGCRKLLLSTSANWPRASAQHFSNGQRSPECDRSGYIMLCRSFEALRPPCISCISICTPSGCETGNMQSALAPQRVCSPTAPCCHLNSVRQRASLCRLRSNAFQTRPAAGRSALSTRCAAATLEAPPAAAPPPDDAGEVSVTLPPLRTAKKRSRRFREMDSKVPLKTTALGARRCPPSGLMWPHATCRSRHSARRSAKAAISHQRVASLPSC